MKVVCAWCKRHMKGYEDAPSVSHGICPACADKHFEKQLRELEQSLSQLPRDPWVDIGGEG